MFRYPMVLGTKVIMVIGDALPYQTSVVGSTPDYRCNAGMVRICPRCGMCYLLRILGVLRRIMPSRG